jgi:hypothetical protein
MNIILISYDLMAPGKDYGKLHEHLKSYPTWAKPLESLWLIKTSYNPTQIRNRVAQYVDQNDHLFVIDVTGAAAAWKNLSTEISEWIKNNL